MKVFTNVRLEDNALTSAKHPDGTSIPVRILQSGAHFTT